MNAFMRTMAKILVFIMAVAVMIPVSTGAVAAAGNTYYVSPSGDDSNSGTLDAPWKTLAHAGDILIAGDTLFVRGGSYAGDYFYPANTGTAEAPITVKAYPDETPVLTAGSGDPIEIVSFHEGKNYIIFDGLHFQDTGWNTNMCFYGNNHITIRNCTFKNSLDSFIYIGKSSYITIEKCIFDTCGNPLGEGEGDSIYVNGCDHVLIQDNYFTKAGHYAVDLKEMNWQPIYSHHNVIRNNIIEQHWGGGIGIICKSYSNLVENNKIYFSGEECIEYGKTGIQVAADRNIVRNNIIARSSAGPVVDTGLFLSSYYGPREVTQNCVDNRIYNNVMYKNGGMPLQISAKHNTDFTRNKILNNVMYYNRLAGDDYDEWFKGNFHMLFETWHLTLEKVWESNFPNGNFFYNNVIAHATADGDQPDSVRIFYDGTANVDGTKTWGVYKFDKSLAEVQESYSAYFHDNIEQNPGFINADSGDFRFKIDSLAVNTGAHLTRTTVNGKNTKEVLVEDALFFTDGFGIIPGDMVKVGSNRNVRITAVNFETNTISVSDPVTFNEGDYVDLWYLGSAPDMGMNEKLAVDAVDSLDETLKDGATKGYITGDGLLNSLLIKTDTLQKEMQGNNDITNGLKTLKNELEAQSGKGISSDFADSLLEILSYLMDLCNK
jgi:hypothetical protein